MSVKLSERVFNLDQWRENIAQKLFVDVLVNNSAEFDKAPHQPPCHNLAYALNSYRGLEVKSGKVLVIGRERGYVSTSKPYTPEQAARINARLDAVRAQLDRQPTQRKRGLYTRISSYR